jgi:two-component system sensor histidine kinase CpxA
VLTTAADLTVVGDPALLRSGFENVLRNAIRYAPPGSPVELIAAPSQSSEDPATDVVEVRIEDRGPGVPSEMLERIFEPYTRLAPAGDDSTGTGLGLAIARRVFAAHGGHIRAEPVTPCGLRVRITLPRAC